MGGEGKRLDEEGKSGGTRNQADQARADDLRGCVIPELLRDPSSAAAATTTAATIAASATAHGLEDARLGAGAATPLLAGLFVIRDALDVLGETFLFAHLLKAAEHLFGGLVAARLHFDHERDPFDPTVS